MKCAWRVVQGVTWGCGVYAPHGDLAPIELGAYPGWLVGAVVTGLKHPGEPGPLHVYSLHAPGSRHTGLTYQAAVNQMLVRAGQGRWSSRAPRYTPPKERGFEAAEVGGREGMSNEPLQD